MIRISSLSYRYNRKKTVIKNLDLILEPGKVYGLLGKNGAGKSSLIRNITGMLFPTSGNCLVGRHKPQDRETAFVEDMFFIPENCDLPALPMADFVAVYAPFYPSFDLASFRRYLDVFNIPTDSHLRQLSFGQKKKTYIAFALAANTRVLIMDEPTNGLDIPSKIQLRNTISACAGDDKITIISTHQVRDLDDLINSVIIMDNGEVLLFADKETITRKLFFSQSRGPHQDILYQEETNLGTVFITRNRYNTPSYLDLEVLFNATLNAPSTISPLFTKNDATV